MPKLQLLSAWIVLLVALPCPLSASKSPNVLLILADDLGYSDLGCYGGEIETPQLDSLANAGLRFTHFTNTGRCWPTRAALMTGYYAHQVRRDRVPGVKKSGSRGVRPQWARLLGQMLSERGYRCYHSGKWHIDGPVLAGGFHRSYRLADHGRFFSPRRHFEDDRPLAPVKRGTGYYATTHIADHAIQCLQDHAKSHAKKPFFQFLAFTAPHFPLHAHEEDTARYREKYRVGWKAIREERWKKLQSLGIAGGQLSKVERDVGPPYHFPDALETLGPGETNRPLPWDTLTPEQQRFQAEKMAIHAAMVYRMDVDIGRVIAQIRSMKALENTLVLFLSDNGASAEIMVRDDGHDPKAAPGSAASHLCLGPGWSTASNTPFRRHKTWVHEGGVATPFIAHWPAGFLGKNELRHTPAHVIDIVPTILEITRERGSKLSHPPDAPPFSGRSLTSVFQSDGDLGRPYTWWEHGGNRAIRVGPWKLVASGKDGPWELYNLDADRAETHDLASKQPDRVEQLANMWEAALESFRVVATKDLVEDK